MGSLLIIPVRVVAHNVKGIGYSATFLGEVGFYMSVAFYAFSFLINVLCSGMFLQIVHSTLLNASNVTGLVMWRVIVVHRRVHKSLKSLGRQTWWKVFEATIQSTAINAVAAVSLVITFANSTEVAYPTCLNLFPALIVRQLTWAHRPKTI